MTRLIDADALKEEFDIIASKSATGNWQTIPIKHIKQIIDNAPTVETDIEVVAKDAYEHGYTDGWKERFGEPDGRPNGKWVRQDDKWVQCSNCKDGLCGISIAGFEYCPFCGADMRKEEKNEMS